MADPKTRSFVCAHDGPREPVWHDEGAIRDAASGAVYAQQIGERCLGCGRVFDV
jgi:hypothetical protein